MPQQTGKTGSNRKSVTLFVPGFQRHDVRQIRQLVGQQQPLNALAVLLSRSNYHRGKHKSQEHTLFDLFNLGQPESAELPIGALTRYLIKGNQPDNRWAMRADPVFIQPNRDHLVLLGNAELDISFEEAQKIANDINETYGDTQWQLIALTPQQWVVEQKKPEQLQTSSLPDVVGKNINDFLPQGDDQKNWRALMNELQMFLHAHPVNQQRQMQGLPVVNSVWFWGAGILPELSPSEGIKSFTQCWSDETVSLALARLTNVPRTDLTQNCEAWLKQAITPGHHLLVTELLNSAQAKNDPLEWWQSMVQFDREWLSGLVDAVKQNTIEQLQVIDSDGGCYQLTRRLARRWGRPGGWI